METKNNLQFDHMYVSLQMEYLYKLSKMGEVFNSFYFQKEGNIPDKMFLICNNNTYFEIIQENQYGKPFAIAHRAYNNDIAGIKKMDTYPWEMKQRDFDGYKANIHNQKTGLPVNYFYSWVMEYVTEIPYDTSANDVNHIVEVGICASSEILPSLKARSSYFPLEPVFTSNMVVISLPRDNILTKIKVALDDSCTWSKLQYIIVDGTPKMTGEFDGFTVNDMEKGVRIEFQID